MRNSKDQAKLPTPSAQAVFVGSHANADVSQPYVNGDVMYLLPASPSSTSYPVLSHYYLLVSLVFSSRCKGRCTIILWYQE